MARKKIDLSEEAANSNAVEPPTPIITDDVLKEVCPKNVLARLKAAKTPAQRADLLFTLDREDLKELRDAYNEMDGFVKKLKAWFVQEFDGDQQGVTGKLGRVEIKKKDVPVVKDWTKFYAYIKKNSAFELLNKAVNAKSVNERWEQKKEVPGIEAFSKASVSLTKK